MTEILAAVENSRTSQEVLDVARTLAGVLATDVEAVYAHENDGHVAAAVAGSAGVPLRVLIGEPAPAIVRALEDDEVLLAVVGAGRFRTVRHPVGRVTRDVMAQARKPIVVVPPDPAPTTPGHARVVVPLDGVSTTCEAVHSVLCQLASAGAEVVGLHVFNAGDVPPYWDHAYHDFLEWFEGFWPGNCPAPGARLEIGWGPVVPEVLRVAKAERATLIALPWRQRPADGPGPVVTELLRTTRTPVLLVPEPASILRPATRALTSAV